MGGWTFSKHVLSSLMKPWFDFPSHGGVERFIGSRAWFISSQVCLGRQIC